MSTRSHWTSSSTHPTDADGRYATGRLHWRDALRAAVRASTADSSNGEDSEDVHPLPVLLFLLDGLGFLSAINSAPRPCESNLVDGLDSSGQRSHRELQSVRLIESACRYFVAVVSGGTRVLHLPGAFPIVCERSN